MQFLIAPCDEVRFSADFLDEAFGAVEGEALLVDVIEDDIAADGDGTGGGLGEAHEEAEEGGFTHAVAADDAGAGAGGEGEVEIFEEGAGACVGGDGFGIDDDVPELGGGGMRSSIS